MTDLQSIRKLKWVSKVSNKDGLVVTTKKNILKTSITHFISSESTIRSGIWFSPKKLPLPIIVGLPSYDIQILDYGFRVKLKTKPKEIRGERILRYPQATTVSSSEFNRLWNKYKTVCFGSSHLKEYKEAQTDFQRAQLAAMYLQSAIPDFGGEGRKSIWAYSLGLVGDEIKIKN